MKSLTSSCDVPFVPFPVFIVVVMVERSAGGVSVLCRSRQVARDSKVDGPREMYRVAKARAQL